MQFCQIRKENAAREAAEESLEVFGTADELLKYLRATNGVQMYPNCFLVNLGQKSDETREEIVDLFHQRRWNSNAKLTQSEMEIEKLRWVSAESTRF
jgi:hypothetical protein